jgi:hypothetical protein
MTLGVLIVDKPPDQGPNGCTMLLIVACSACQTARLRPPQVDMLPIPRHAPKQPPPAPQERGRALAGGLDKPFITVMRPTRDSKDGKLHPVQLPTGSVRASLGSLSTFEDVYALVTFLTHTYLE